MCMEAWSVFNGIFYWTTRKYLVNFISNIFRCKLYSNEIKIRMYVEFKKCLYEIDVVSVDNIKG